MISSKIKKIKPRIGRDKYGRYWVKMGQAIYGPFAGHWRAYQLKLKLS